MHSNVVYHNMGYLVLLLIVCSGDNDGSKLMMVVVPKDHCETKDNSDFKVFKVEFIENKRSKKQKEILGLQIASSK